jgi:hypothetical protein
LPEHLAHRIADLISWPIRRVFNEECGFHFVPEFNGREPRGLKWAAKQLCPPALVQLSKRFRG